MNAILNGETESQSEEEKGRDEADREGRTQVLHGVQRNVHESSHKLNVTITSCDQILVVRRESWQFKSDINVI